MNSVASLCCSQDSVLLLNAGNLYKIYISNLLCVVVPDKKEEKLPSEMFEFRVPACMWTSEELLIKLLHVCRKWHHLTWNFSRFYMELPHVAIAYIRTCHSYAVTSFNTYQCTLVQCMVWNTMVMWNMRMHALLDLISLNYNHTIVALSQNLATYLVYYDYKHVCMQYGVLYVKISRPRKLAARRNLPTSISLCLSLLALWSDVNFILFCMGGIFFPRSQV